MKIIDEDHIVLQPFPLYGKQCNNLCSSLSNLGKRLRIIRFVILSCTVNACVPH